jgi:hypothetical protein
VRDAVRRSGQSIYGGVKLGQRWEAGRSGIWWRRGPGLAGAGWERGLTGGAHTSVREEREGTEDERHE